MAVFWPGVRRGQNGRTGMTITLASFLPRYVYKDIELSSKNNLGGSKLMPRKALPTDRFGYSVFCNFLGACSFKA